MFSLLHIIFDERMILDINFNVEIMEKIMTVKSSEPVDPPFTNELLCSPNFAHEQDLSFLVCESHNFIVYLLLV